MNNNFILGSSETTCETLKNYDLSSFYYWLIGFVEGDGSFIVSKNGYLEFKITQLSKDAQILFYIKKSLGFGSVSIQDKLNKTHHFRVRDKFGLLKLINIFNGNLHLNKRIIQFKIWIEAYNKLYNTNILFVENNNIINLNNAWLCGFTDAEGCFTVSIIKRSENHNQVFVRFILSQQNEFILFNLINNLLNGTISYLKSYNGYNLTVNLNNLDIVIKYFNKYSLLTKKLISYKIWLKIYKLVKLKAHFTKSGLEEIQYLKHNLNKNNF
jgi:hypothetical protein